MFENRNLHSGTSGTISSGTTTGTYIATPIVTMLPFSIDTTISHSLYIDSNNSTMIFNKQHNGQSSLYINIVAGVINFHFDDNVTNWDAQANITLSINTIYLLTIIWNGTNLIFRINGIKILFNC